MVAWRRLQWNLQTTMNGPPEVPGGKQVPRNCKEMAMDGTLKSMRGRAEPVTVKESLTRREQRHRLPLAA